MTSVRESLNIVGQAASIRQLAQQRNAEFPLSLRNFVGALPPGKIYQKVVPVDFLQKKLDIFFNERIRPLFEIRLNSEKHQFGQSALTIAMDSTDGYDHDHPVLYQELAGPGETLDFDGHTYYFQDLRSSSIELNITAGESLTLTLDIHFECDGPFEFKVEDLSDIDFKGLIVKMNFRFGLNEGQLDPVSFLSEIDQAMETAAIVMVPVLHGPDIPQLTTRFRGEQIQLRDYDVARMKATAREVMFMRDFMVNVSVDVNDLPDGYVASKIESNVRSKTYDALRDQETREALGKVATRWLIGGDFLVTNVTVNEQSLTVDYLVPRGQLEPFPESTQAPLDPGPLANIKHIVVLMMENRSFDHMVGYLSKEGGRDGRRADVDGLRGGESNSDGYGHAQTVFPLGETRFKESPDHSFRPVLNQINGGKMDGFFASFAAKYPDVPDPGKIMGYHTAAHVPVYDALASHFTLCQRWFAAHPGPTFCNRFYTLTGRLNRNSAGQFEFDNFSGDDFKPVSSRTIFDHLTDRGVSWRFYEHRYCSLRLFGRYTTDTTFVVDADDPLTGFFASAAAGTLPAVSFIDPNFIDEADGQDNDDGAPSDIMAGQNLIGRVVNAVMKGPKWSETLLVITYDEHGGFYDHVNPLDPAYRGGAKPVSGIDHYGVRVPAFVVSPWVDARVASNVVFDHTSIAKTIARCFMSTNPPDMGERVTAANDLSMVMRTSPRRDTPDIPIPPAPPALVRPALVAASAGQEEADDFKGVMRAMRARYPLER